MKNKNKKIKKERRELKGIGGWLIFPIIMFIVYGILALFNFISNLNLMMSGLSFKSITIFELGIVGLYAYTLFLIFKEKKEALKFSIITIWTTFAYYFIASIIFNIELFGSLWGAIIWTLYFLKSKRVKNTFVK